MKKLYENCLGKYNVEITDIVGGINKVNKMPAITKVKKQLPSISKIVGLLHKDFDKDGVSKMMVEKYFNDPSSKYYQMSQQQILDLWDLKGLAGRTLGQSLDLMMQSFTKDSTHYTAKTEKAINLDSFLKDKKNITVPEQFSEFIDPNDITDKADQLLKFYKMMYSTSKKKGYVNIIIGSEIDIVNMKYGYKGRLDSLWYCKNIEDSSKDFIILIDYKNTKNLTTTNNFGEHLFGPLSEYPDCDLNLYTIQLYLYKNALVETYKIPESKIVPRVLNITADQCCLYEPVIPYSDKLVKDITDFARSTIF